MRPYLLLYLLVSCFLNTGFSQTHQEEQSHYLTSIPMEMLTGGIIIIKALLDGHPDSLTFVLDTGSGGISLDSATVQSLGLQPGTPEKTIRGVGGIRKVGVVHNKCLRFNTLSIDSLNFHVLDYSVLSSLYGQKIDGIIGYSMLIRYIIKLNYDTQQVEFWSQGKLKYPKGGSILKANIKGIPVLQSNIRDANRKKFTYLFDIGAGLTVLFRDTYLTDHHFLKPYRKRYLKQGEGLGGKIDMYQSVMKELKIGKFKFRNVPINYFKDEYNVTSYPSTGGLIGNDIFRRFNCILNYAKKEIHIIPNKSTYSPFDYAYSGIELYLIDGKAVVGSIPANSPADKAGIQEGDEVIAINNKFGMQLKDLKEALIAKYGKVKVIIRRNGELMDKTMDVVNITKK